MSDMDSDRDEVRLSNGMKRDSCNRKEVLIKQIAEISREYLENKNGGEGVKSFDIGVCVDVLKGMVDKR